MASSRRRERELARRRYERRRLREQQLRARRRRRNTILGASVGTAAVIAAVVLLALHFAGSGGTATAADKVSATPTAATTPTPAPEAAAAKKCAPIKPNPPHAGLPKIPDWTKPVPSNVATVDLKKGNGPTVQKGSTVTVDYIGIGCSTGAVFDASYLHPQQPLTVTIGGGQVIPGFDQGMIGMHEGGTRELVIPAKLAYGAAGSPPAIGPNAPLIFVVSPTKAPSPAPTP